jgi:uncharacterized membrane protein YGL010W
MSKIDSYFEDYAQYHQTSGNLLTHTIGIPLIVVAVLSWSARWVGWHSVATELPGSLLQMDLGCLLIILVSAWYCRLDWKLGISFLPVLYGLYWIGRTLPISVACAFFVLGWILQLVGHSVFEKKSPAFTKNIEHLLIGPIWVFVKVLRLERKA